MHDNSQIDLCELIGVNGNKYLLCNLLFLEHDTALLSAFHEHVGRWTVESGKLVNSGYN
jgi:hypothetical protein